MDTEFSERARLVTDLVQMWIDNDGDHVDEARRRAVVGHQAMRNYLKLVLLSATRSSAPWQAAQDLAPNDYDRVDWVGIARRLTAEE